MKQYRVYTLSTFDAITRPARVLEFENDGEALKEAAQLLDGHNIEVWEGARWVARLDADSKQADPQ